MRFPDREFWVKVDQKLLFLGKNREIGKNWEIFKKSEKRQYNHDDFVQVLPKSSLATFKTVFVILSALGACYVTIIGGVVNKKSMIFEGISAIFYISS